MRISGLVAAYSLARVHGVVVMVQVESRRQGGPEYGDLLGQRLARSE
jgi:hypothetical protein